MKKYDSYKDSGVKWIGKIPSSWSKSKFKYLTTKNVQYGINSSSDNYIDDGIRFIRTTDIDDFGNLKPGGVFVSQNEIDESQITDYLDFLISRSGTLGRTYLHKFDEQMTYGGYLVRFNFGKLITSKFLQYYCYSTNFWDWINLNTIVSTIGNVNGQKYNNMDVPFPPLSEQQQIVTFLDTKTTLIDSLIEKTQRKIELLKEKRTSLINEVVTKGLNPNVEMKDSGVEWIGEIPSHWETTKFKFKGEVIIGLSYKPENQVDENDGVLVMRSSNVQNGKPSFHDNVYVDCKISDKLRTREGDILICSRNGSRKLIGKNCLITKEIEGMSWGVFMTMYRTPYYKFFYWLLNSPVFKSQSGLFLTSTINQLTVSTLENMVVPYVSDKIEQQQIVEYLDEQTQLIDKTISIEEKRIELLKEYRQSLISEVVTGKRKVVV